MAKLLRYSVMKCYDYLKKKTGIFLDTFAWELTLWSIFDNKTDTSWNVEKKISNQFQHLNLINDNLYLITLCKILTVISILYCEDVCITVNAWGLQVLW